MPVPVPVPDFNANGDIAASDGPDILDDVESQTQTQSTQQASQLPVPPSDAHLWGYLQPCNTQLPRIDFWKMKPCYTIGRNNDSAINDVIFLGPKVSECRIQWRGAAASWVFP